MLGLSKKESKFFVNSFVLHVLVLLVVGAIGLMPSCEEEKEEVHVFELVSSAYVAPEPEKIKKIIQVPSPKPVKVPAKKVVNPRPVPKEKKHVKPVPQKTVKPSPKPEPKPKPVVKPQKISINQFQKKHNLTPPKPKSRPVKHAPKVTINSSLSLHDIKISDPFRQNTSVDPTLLNKYLTQVKNKLETAWRRLRAGSSVATGGEAYLSFSISSSGFLVSPYISRSSGNAELDRLVLKVSQSVGNLGRPPGGRLTSSLEIPFKVQ